MLERVRADGMCYPDRQDASELQDSRKPSERELPRPSREHRPTSCTEGRGRTVLFGLRASERDRRREWDTGTVGCIPGSIQE